MDPPREVAFIVLLGLETRADLIRTVDPSARTVELVRPFAEACSVLARRCKLRAPGLRDGKRRNAPCGVGRLRAYRVRSLENPALWPAAAIIDLISFSSRASSIRS